MQKVAYLFWTVVGVIVVAFGMSVYTAIQTRKNTPITDPSAIATPALPATGGATAPAATGGVAVPAMPNQ